MDDGRGREFSARCKDNLYDTDESSLFDASITYTKLIRERECSARCTNWEIDDKEGNILNSSRHGHLRPVSQSYRNTLLWLLRRHSDGAPLLSHESIDIVRSCCAT